MARINGDIGALQLLMELYIWNQVVLFSIFQSRGTAKAAQVTLEVKQVTFSLQTSELST